MPKLHNCYKSAVLTLSCDFLGEKTCQAPFRGSWWFLMDLHHHLLPWTTALLKLRNHNSRLLFETHRLNKHLGPVIGEKSQTQLLPKGGILWTQPILYGGCGCWIWTNECRSQSAMPCRVAKPQYNARWYSSNHWTITGKICCALL